jgi:hypothetical protein
MTRPSNTLSGNEATGRTICLKSRDGDFWWAEGDQGQVYKVHVSDVDYLSLYGVIEYGETFGVWYEDQDVDGTVTLVLKRAPETAVKSAVAAIA